jgi:hypothetical protein
MDKQEMIFFPETPDELQHKKDMAQRCKCICLEKMGKHPLLNVSCMTTRDKKKLLAMVFEMMKEPEEEIIAEFNQLCCESILEEDYMTYSVGGQTEPPVEPPIEAWKIDPLEVALEYSRKFPDNAEVSI